MDVKKVLAEGDHYIFKFLANNWGLAISMKTRLKYKCSNDELLGLCIEAYEKAEKTYDESRNKDNGKQYNFVHHWCQHLKSIIVSCKKKVIRELSYEEILETNPSIIPTPHPQQQNDKLYKLQQANELITLLGAQKAHDIVLLLKANQPLDVISAETKIPISKVARAVAIIDQIYQNAS